MKNSVIKKIALLSWLVMSFQCFTAQERLGDVWASVKNIPGGIKQSMANAWQKTPTFKSLPIIGALSSINPSLKDGFLHKNWYSIIGLGCFTFVSWKAINKYFEYKERNDKLRKDAKNALKKAGYIISKMSDGDYDKYKCYIPELLKNDEEVVKARRKSFIRAVCKNIGYLTAASSEAVDPQSVISTTLDGMGGGVNKDNWKESIYEPNKSIFHDFIKIKLERIFLRKFNTEQSGKNASKEECMDDLTGVIYNWWVPIRRLYEQNSTERVSYNFFNMSAAGDARNFLNFFNEELYLSDETYFNNGISVFLTVLYFLNDPVNESYKTKVANCLLKEIKDRLYQLGEHDPHDDAANDNLIRQACKSLSVLHGNGLEGMNKWYYWYYCLYNPKVNKEVVRNEIQKIWEQVKIYRNLNGNNNPVSSLLLKDLRSKNLKLSCEKLILRMAKLIKEKNQGCNMGSIDDTTRKSACESLAQEYNIDKTWFEKACADYKEDIYAYALAIADGMPKLEDAPSSR